MKVPLIHTAWAMPSRWTFTIKPIADLLDRWLEPGSVSVDPFCGKSSRATYRNDLSEVGGVDAEEFCNLLLLHLGEESVDVALFDPPYSPRQISECYKSVGRTVTGKDTQNAALYSRVRKPLERLLKPNGVALSFGWSSSGFGKKWDTEEILLVQHGGAHNDTICVVQRKPERMNEPNQVTGALPSVP